MNKMYSTFEMLYMHFTFPILILLVILIFYKEFKKLFDVLINKIREADDIKLGSSNIILELANRENSIKKQLELIYDKNRLLQQKLEENRGGLGTGGGGGEGNISSHEYELITNPRYLRQELKVRSAKELITELYDLYYHNRMIYHGPEDNLVLNTKEEIDEFYSFSKNIENESLITEDLVINFQKIIKAILDYQQYLSSVKFLEEYN
ncbi:hypothetical protein [Nosocomiicoccus sp. HMSC09A07]|uniref:hypothetical protein n=1 Tax=Nosocomiicoccus sp. HMSC09A07 TaxID=1581145 RepID=UPI0008A1616A|nr:hypothetical protein [Nosocomiicoccus sp. HMSC09A07]OFS62185.1 hypothetical protein HMPREF3177_06725 [Nosocomiicoccus sp. HMSC09A07]